MALTQAEEQELRAILRERVLTARLQEAYSQLRADFVECRDGRQAILARRTVAVGKVTAARDLALSRLDDSDMATIAGLLRDALDALGA